MKISKFLPVLFCCSLVFLNATPLSVIKFSDLSVTKFKKDKVDKKAFSCVYRIRVQYEAYATISVSVGGTTVLNKTYGYPRGNDIVNVTVPTPQIATINATDCTVYVSCLSSGAYYVVDDNPINTQLFFNTADCSVDEF